MPGAYFDQNATTPLLAEVRDEIWPWMSERVGNPSSAHGYGQRAAAAVERARAEVAGLVGARAEEIVFTGSGSEANNAVVADALRRAAPGDKIVVSALEHPSILAAAARGEERGVRVVRIPPNGDGVVLAERIAAQLDPTTRLVALQLVNNELGTVQPVAEVARACRAAGVPLLSDAVQAAGKLAIDVAMLGVDYLTLGAHKFGGPLGAAALWIRPGAPFVPLLVGGAQERRRRASTVNVPAVVGFGAACRIARRDFEAHVRHLARLRDRFEAEVVRMADVRIHGANAPRVPHVSNLAFLGLVNLDLMMRLDLAGFAVSTGPACGSGVVEPTPTLAALGLPREEAIASLRVSFGVSNTDAELDAFLPVLVREVAALRAETTAAAARP